MRSTLPFTRGPLHRFAVLAFALACSLGLGSAWAQPRSTPTAPATQVDGPGWASLTPRQKSVLEPLQRDWTQLEPQRRTKWIEIADRYHRLSPAEQARLKERMSAWARMTPSERTRARQNYKEAQQLSPQDRKARWEAYRALPPDEREALASRAPTSNASANAERERRRELQNAERQRLTKSNIVPGAPSYAPKPKAVAPTITQARPGATTNPISKRAAPPAHQQAGQPKIAATPGFVDEATLLPQRGPQGAAARSNDKQRSPKPNP